MRSSKDRFNKLSIFLVQDHLTTTRLSVPPVKTSEGRYSSSTVISKTALRRKKNRRLSDRTRTLRIRIRIMNLTSLSDGN